MSRIDEDQNVNSAPSPVVRLIGVSKSFGGVRALDNVDFEVSAGEIHALLGENGAGKSTILKILNGVHAPSAGAIEVNGAPLGDHTPEAARRAGIGMIFQEMSLAPTLTVAQNIFLNHELKGRLNLIDDEEAARRSRELFESLGVEVDPLARVADLSAGQRQLTEIVKAISRDVRVLVLDEPTTALSGGEVEKLFAILRRLRAKGVAIIYVSHRMDEIARIADRATILRDGRRVITAPMSELTLDKIIEHIVGRRSRGFSDVARKAARRGAPLLEIKGLSGLEKPSNIDLTLYAGEVVGVAGLLGSGRSALARVLFGVDRKRSGEIRIKGGSVEIGGPRDAIARGLVLVPEDRLRQGLILEHSVEANASLAILDRLASWFFVSRAKAADAVDRQIAALRIRASSRDAAARTLSGGNQQKVVVAKWLNAEPDIFVLDEPTAGVDIGSKAEIIALIRGLAERGKAVLVISSELSELLTASDRILVMTDGRIVAEYECAEFDDHDSNDDVGERLHHAERRLSSIVQQAYARH
ncbi:MAG TPA: sugar ABC transporter ATP-binding protein [Roseiarcus sp.]|nr:sugar ABC transporter ATP-binding protein [Roseiarcus sp.]